MRKGIRRQEKNLSYVKEGFRILNLCGAWKEILSSYEALEEKLQSDSRMRFYYILALARDGRQKEAYERMEADGGLVIDDNREGEDVLAELWLELHEAVYGEQGEVPYRYQFQAFE